MITLFRDIQTSLPSILLLEGENWSQQLTRAKVADEKVSINVTVFAKNSVQKHSFSFRKSTQRKTLLLFDNELHWTEIKTENDDRAERREKDSMKKFTWKNRIEWHKKYLSIANALYIRNGKLFFNTKAYYARGFHSLIFHLESVLWKIHYREAYGSWTLRWKESDERETRDEEIEIGSRRVTFELLDRFLFIMDYLVGFEALKYWLRGGILPRGLSL